MVIEVVIMASQRQIIYASMHKHILIIDDDTQELRKLREILTREGYDIMTATDKETAYHISEKVSINFVLAKASTLGFGNDNS